MPSKRGPSLLTKKNVAALACVIVLCLIFLIIYRPDGVKLDMLAELIKLANLLGYFKVALYIYCLIYVRTHDVEESKTLFVILLAWFIGDIIDTIDGPIARYTKTDSAFGEKMDHRVIDVLREPFAWLLLYMLYPKFATFWHILLFRMFIKEDETFEIPRVPILPFINVAWYIPVLIALRYLNIPNNLVTKALKFYIACIFITWGLEGDPHQKIRLDYYVQCYVLWQQNSCDSIWYKNKTLNDNKI